ncbi:hypothetical protein BJ508DRAFT_183142 [Ascobolus immersus RN42]|uniref:AB hydrolase-1 domain-containing protein n=1 Tax=Ascobolus immersus RN42 TaxID=1160509 RepID=A0A3N4HXG1_ASCIM|nr:hypothetical protein BJ508DRAFT_183142 [Ascobolus immersus RN42]
MRVFLALHFFFLACFAAFPLLFFVDFVSAWTTDAGGVTEGLSMEPESGGQAQVVSDTEFSYADLSWTLCRELLVYSDELLSKYEVTVADLIALSDNHCAVVTRKLNPSDPSDTRTYTMRVMRILPSAVSETDPSYLGTLLFINGGPGGSGVQELYNLYATFKDIASHYTILTADLRGTYNTNHGFTCFDDPWDEWLFDRQRFERMGTSLMLSKLSGAEKQRASAFDFGKKCHDKIGGSDGLLRLAGAAPSAADLEFLHRSYWRQEHPDTEFRADIREDLNLWSVSYGGLVADAVRRLFPGQVQMDVRESTLDLSANEDHSQAYLSELTDVEDGLKSLYHYCSEGSATCSLAMEDNRALTSQQVEERVWRVLKHFQDRVELEIPDASLELSELFATLFQALYAPKRHAPSLFDRLTSLDELIQRTQNPLSMVPLHSAGFPNYQAFKDLGIAHGQLPPEKTAPSREGDLLTCPDVVKFGLENVSPQTILETYYKAAKISWIGADALFLRWSYCLYLQEPTDKAAFPIPGAHLNHCTLYIPFFTDQGH